VYIGGEGKKKIGLAEKYNFLFSDRQLQLSDRLFFAQHFNFVLNFIRIGGFQP